MQQRTAVRVAPLHVIDEDGHGRLLGQGREHLGDALGESPAVRRRRRPGGLERREPGAELRNHTSHFGEPGGIGPGEAGRVDPGPQRVDDRAERRASPRVVRPTAKAGFVDKARSLSGYVTTADGRVLLFSFLCNNWTTSSREVDQVADAIAVRLAGLTGR